MSNLSTGDGISKGSGHVILADKVVKRLGPVLTIKGEMAQWTFRKKMPGRMRRTVLRLTVAAFRPWRGSASFRRAVPGNLMIPCRGQKETWVPPFARNWLDYARGS